MFLYEHTHDSMPNWRCSKRDGTRNNQVTSTIIWTREVILLTTSMLKFMIFAIIMKLYLRSY